MASKLVGLALLLLSGCSGEASSDVEDFETRGQDLRCADENGNPINDANCPWKFLARQTPRNINNDISHRMSPAVCATPSSTGLTITVDSTNKYRTLQWHWFGADSWASYGNKAFSTRPACAMREMDPQGQGFVIAGKGVAPDNKIYASAGRMAPGNDPQLNPTAVTQFAPVSNTTYATGGAPAIATGGFGTDSVVLVFMGDDSRTIYAHVRPLPYLSNNWTDRITGPVLPTGWTAVGAPSIARLPVTLQIVVHGRNAFGQSRLFETHFYANNQHFSNAIGSPPASWSMLPNMGTIDGEPALTFSDFHGSTVYFRRGTQIMQTSGNPLGQNPVLAVKPNENIAFTGSPAALANWAFESQNGRHTMIARTTSNQLYNATSMPDFGIVP